MAAAGRRSAEQTSCCGAVIKIATLNPEVCRGAKKSLSACLLFPRRRGARGVGERGDADVGFEVGDMLCKNVPTF